MQTATLFVILLGIAVPACAQTSAPEPKEFHPNTSIREYFFGAWKLISAEYEFPDGHKTPYPDLGPKGVGFLLYTPSGHMCAQLMDPARPRWADDDAPTAAEAGSALAGFTSYCGAYEVHEHNQTVVHRPQTAWSPNWIGTEQLRPYHLVSQDRFFFRGSEMQKQKDGTNVKVTWTITWERLKESPRI